MEEYDSISEYFNSHNVPIYFAPIPPVLIKKYRDFNFSRSLRTCGYAETEKQNISNIRWNRSICKYVTIKGGKHGQNLPKKMSFIYTELYDGVHPSLEQSNKWYS